MLSRYRVCHPLESGPGARVFRVVDRLDPKAKKILTLLTSGKLEETRKYELSCLYDFRKNLDHPGLPDLHDIAFKGRRVGLVSDFIDHPNLVDANFKAWPEPKRMSVALQTVELLAYLHRKGFYCGYLRPSHLFVEPEGKILANVLLPGRIFDWKSGPGDWVRYAAREFVSHQTVNEKTDLYSLGMLLYHLFTGSPPFQQGDAQIMRYKQLSIVPDRPRKLNPDISSSLEELIWMLIAKNPEDRPNSMKYVQGFFRNKVGLGSSNPPRLCSRMIGRKDELAGFCNLYRDWENNPVASFVGVAGVSGIGKTRLMERLEIQAKLSNVQVFKIHHHRTTRIYDALWQIQAQMELLSVPGTEVSSTYREAPKPLAKRLIHRLREITEDRNLVICVDDMHQMDEGSLEFYRRILLREKLPVLILGNYRTDELSVHWRGLKAALKDKSNFHEFRIDALRPGEVIQLLGTLLADDPPRDLYQLVLPACRGNPFYVYELMRFLVGEGELLFDQNCWRWCPNKKTLKIPETVVERILARVRKLDTASASVLDYLSVLENPITIEQLARMMDMERPQLERSLEILKMLDFVCLIGTLRTPYVTLSHDWLGEVNRLTQQADVQKNIHRRVAVVLELEYLKSQNPVLLGRLVHHFLESDHFSEIQHYVWTFIDWGQKEYLYSDCGKVVIKVLGQTSVRQLPWKWVEKAVDILFSSGQLDKCVRLLREYLTFSRYLDLNQKVFVYSRLGRFYTLQGHLSEAMHFLDKACKLIEESTDRNQMAELWGDKLYCLSRSGQLSQARTLANQLVQKMKCGVLGKSAEKLHHALWSYYYLIGDLEIAARYEITAIQMALQQGKLVRALGRLSNFAGLQVESGNLRSAKTLCEKIISSGEEIGNLELVLCANCVLCACERKMGNTKVISRRIFGLLRQNKALGRSSQIKVELSIELAKSFNDQLLPEQAFIHIEKADEILRQQPVRESWFDAQTCLLSGWLLLGRPGKAIQVLGKLNSKDIPREKGRYLMLSAQTHRALMDLSKAWKDACRALASFPKYMSYYRSQCRLLQGEILLASNQSKKAEYYIKEGLSLAVDKFYLPLMVKGYMLTAHCFFVEGKIRAARTHYMRALQLSKHIERPALVAEICHQLGRAEALLGNTGQAAQYFNQSLQILKERQLHISTAHQDSFAKQHIQPIEHERDRLLPRVPQGISARLAQLREFSCSLSSCRDVDQIARRTLGVVKAAMPRISTNVLCRDGNTNHFRVVCSTGHCIRTGRKLISQDHDRESVLFDEESSKSILHRRHSLGFPLRAGSQVMGLVYVEREDREISEGEVEFLICLASIAGIRLANLNQSREGDKAQPTLTVDNQKQLVGQHPSMRRLFDEIRQIGRTDSTVLISGESGTGKELVARTLHSVSRRRNGKFLAINCSAVPKDLIESELFGYGKGSFTGATHDHRGLFESASGGTVFLDEIATMSSDLQARLLRVLQERKVRRLGETTEREIDVRILSASNKNLANLIRQKRFREDLYYRLNVCHIRIPPLRERLTDIPILTGHFLNRLGQQHGTYKEITDEAFAELAGHSFPGNVRELENVLESAYHLTEGMTITSEEIAWRLRKGAMDRAAQSSQVETILEDLQLQQNDFWQAVGNPFLNRDLSRSDVRQIVAAALEVCNGNYRKVLGYLNLPTEDYKKFLSFLSNHDCKVDFRPFRRRPLHG